MCIWLLIVIFGLYAFGTLRLIFIGANKSEDESENSHLKRQVNVSVFGHVEHGPWHSQVVPLDGEGHQKTELKMLDEK